MPEPEPGQEIPKSICVLFDAGWLVGWGGIDEDGATSGVSVHLHEKVQRRMGSSSRSPR